MREIVDAFFRERSIVNHHLASFNDFLPTRDNPNSRMQRIVDDARVSEDSTERGVIRLDVQKTKSSIYGAGRAPARQPRGNVNPSAEPTIFIGAPFVKEPVGSKPTLTPMEARLRNLTYQAPIYLKVTVVENGVERAPEDVHIGDLPIMVKSRPCNLNRYKITEDDQIWLSDEEYRAKLVEYGEDPLDPGGYFIIGGTERVIISLEDLAPNRIFAEYNERYGTPVESAKVFSQRGGYRSLTVVEKKKDGILQVSVPTASGQIPLVILMKALGMKNDEEIFQAVLGELLPLDEPFVQTMKHLLNVNLEECVSKKLYPPEGILTTEDALIFLEKKFATGQAKEYRQRKVDGILDRSLLPHLGDTRADRLKKALYLARMARTVLELHLKVRGEDDKDHYANKRLKLAGDLMEDLFRVAFSLLLKDLKYQLERSFARKKDLRIASAIRPDLLTQRLVHALATGNWVGGRAGVSQVLDRTSHMSTISHLRRVTSPLTRSQPHFEARDLHPTQWGRLCPNETPEGQNCGLVKNYALCVDVSEGADEEEVTLILRDLNTREIGPEVFQECGPEGEARRAGLRQREPGRAPLAAARPRQGDPRAAPDRHALADARRQDLRNQRPLRQRDERGHRPLRLRPAPPPAGRREERRPARLPLGPRRARPRNPLVQRPHPPGQDRMDRRRRGGGRPHRPRPVRPARAVPEVRQRAQPLRRALDLDGREAGADGGRVRALPRGVRRPSTCSRTATRTSRSTRT